MAIPYSVTYVGRMYSYFCIVEGGVSRIAVVMPWSVVGVVVVVPVIVVSVVVVPVVRAPRTPVRRVIIPVP